MNRDAQHRNRCTESQLVEDLVATAASGDLVAQAELFELYWPVIRQIVRGCRFRFGADIRAREQTQDLEQEVALEILLALPKQRWQGRQAFKAWMRKLAAAKVIDRHRYHRAKRRDRRMETGIEGADRADNLQRSPESKADDQRRLEQLSELLDAIKPEYAGAVMLHHLGYAHAEIGEMLECSAEAARKLVSRGEAKLVKLREETNSGL
ncbi:MAG: sigma-70 family RNA polymerase sigma factor [Myxococcota bacterium]